MEQGLDIKTLWHMFTKNIKFISIITIAITVLVFLFSSLIISPKFTSKALLYVKNNQTTSDNLNINDITAAQKLVNTCTILFTSNSMLEMVKTDLNLPYEIDALEKMITVESVNQSEIMKITVETKNAVESLNITNKLVELSIVEFHRVVKSASIEVVSSPKESTSPSSPNIPIYTVIGFILGFIIAFVIVLLREIFDVTVNEDDDLINIYRIPVFAEVMDFELKVKGNYKYEQ